MTSLVALVFGLLIPRLTKARQRMVVWCLAGAMAVYFGLVPVLAPAVVRGSLTGTAGETDGQGVCRQTHDYTCGPAAAVTALRRLGVEAAEGPLAVAAHCGPAVGADGHALARAMTAAAAGRAAFSFRWVGDAGALAAMTPAVVTLDSNLLRGHYVAVLEVTPTHVLIGDPQAGRQRLTRDEFAEEWDGAAVAPDH
jgi:hypothetical protein